jgi:hypothetical protein
LERLAQNEATIKTIFVLVSTFFSLLSISSSAIRQATRRQNTGIGVCCQRLFPGLLTFHRFSGKAIEITFFFSLLFLADLTYHVVFLQIEGFPVRTLPICRQERRREGKWVRNCLKIYQMSRIVWLRSANPSCPPRCR